MIEWASQKSAAQGLTVKWLVADARTFALEKQFPFIYMLGNAFQHLLTRADHKALFARVRDHLRPDGCFFFVTRNPTPKNLFQSRFAEPQTNTMDDGTQLIATEQQHYDPLTQIQHYTFHNRWLYPSGQKKEQTQRTALRYVFPQEMEALLHYNGFHILNCYGNWQNEPLTADSPSMIYICKQRGLS
jgi:hypothetical protein